MFHNDLRHVDVPVVSLGLENANTVQTPIVVDVKDKNPVCSDPEQISKYRSHVARCVFLSQDRANTTFAVNELCQRMSDPSKHRFTKIYATRSALVGRGNGTESSNPGICVQR